MKFVPVRVTLVPPPAGPELGLRPVTVGAGEVTVSRILPMPTTALAPGTGAPVPLTRLCMALMRARRTVVPATAATFRLTDGRATSVVPFAPGTINRLPPTNVAAWKLGTDVVGYRPMKTAVSPDERPPISFVPLSTARLAVVAPAGIAMSW